MPTTKIYRGGGRSVCASQPSGHSKAYIDTDDGAVALTPEDLRAFATEVLELWPAPRYWVEPQHHGLTWRVYDTEMDMSAAHFTQAHPDPEAAARAEAARLNESN